MILNESFISWFGFAWLDLVIAESCLNGHKAGFVICASQFEVDGSWLLYFKDEILSQFFGHLLLHLEVFIDEFVVVECVAYEWLALVAFLEADFDIACYGTVENNVDVV